MTSETKKSTIRIELTAAQKEQIKQATGKEVSSLELEPETLDERAAPAVPPTRG
jgi:hypothetical protein